MLLEKWCQQTCSKQVCRKPSICKKHNYLGSAVKQVMPICHWVFGWMWLGCSMREEFEKRRLVKHYKKQVVNVLMQALYKASCLFGSNEIKCCNQAGHIIPTLPCPPHCLQKNFSLLGLPQVPMSKFIQRSEKMHKERKTVKQDKIIIVLPINKVKDLQFLLKGYR